MSPKDQFSLRRRVEFAETDLAGIMHFSNFFRLMEVTEHAFYRSLGFSVHDFRPEPEGPRIGWPRVHAEADYREPLRFEEEVEVELLVAELRTRSIRYQFRFWREPDGKRSLAATGEFVVACVQFGEEEGQMRAVEIPDAIRRRMKISEQITTDAL